MRYLRFLMAALFLSVPLTGCGDDPPGATAASNSLYVDRVEALLDPAAKMAQLVTDQTKNPPGPWPAVAEVDRLLEAAESGLDQLRAVPLADPGLREQRRRLADAYAAALGQMRDVGGDLVRRDRRRLRADAPGFLSALGDLTSRT